MSAATAWLYCRLSQDDPASVSIETQTATGRAAAMERCPGAAVVLLADRDVSGGVPLLERPQGRRLHDAARGDHIIVTKTDRVFRAVVDGGQMIDWCLSRGVSLHLLDLGLDTSTPIGRAMAQVAIVFAELERHQVSSRRRAAAATRRRLQRPTMDVRHAPLGWRIVAVDGGREFAPDPEERAVCRSIRDLRRRMTWLRIVDRLLALGVPRRHGHEWTRSGVRRACLAAQEKFPLVSYDCRRWGSESGRFRAPRLKRGKPDTTDGG